MSFGSVESGKRGSWRWARAALFAAATFSVGCAAPARGFDGVHVAGAPQRALTQDDLVRKSAEAVAVVETDIGRGMAFVIDPAGYLITNRHVVEDAAHVESLTFLSHDPPLVLESVQVEYIDPTRDLALLHVNSPDPLPRMPLASRKSAPVKRYLDEEDPVVLFRRIGEDFEPAELIANNGSVTDLTVYNPAAGDGAFVGVTLNVQRGQSGGPVVDRHGRAVGIITWTWRDKVGGFAIPISEATRMLEERPRLGTDVEHADRAAIRSREFLAALGRGDVDDARRLTSPSHARDVREAVMEQITRGMESGGTPVLQGFFAAVEGLVEEAPEEDRFDELRKLVARTGTPHFREAMSLPESVDLGLVMSFFLELGQAYLAARVAGEQSPADALEAAMRRLQTVDAARTFAMVGFLEELAGTEIEIETVQVVPGAYQPRAVVTLKGRRHGQKLSSRSLVGLDPKSPRATSRKIRYTLHMKLEWGDWYVARVSERTLDG